MKPGLMRKQVEYLVVTYDEEKKRCYLSLRQADILVALARDEELCKRGGCVPALQDLPRYVFINLVVHRGALLLVAATTYINPSISFSFIQRRLHQLYFTLLISVSTIRCCQLQ